MGITSQLRRLIKEEAKSKVKSKVQIDSELPWRSRMRFDTTKAVKGSKWTPIRELSFAVFESPHRLSGDYVFSYDVPKGSVVDILDVFYDAVMVSFSTKEGQKEGWINVRTLANADQIS